MSRAHRCIAVWMIGALASAVVYEVRALPGADPVGRRAAAPAQPPLADDTRETIVEYLRVHYDDVESLDGGYSLTGLAYIPAQAPVVEVRNPVLRRFLPDTRFFKTTLESPYMEYRRVETLVSFRSAGERDDIRTCLSPTFRTPSDKFISQFVGISASTLEARRELALAIAELLAEITYRGKARPSPGAVDARAELWHGHLIWRVVSVFSDFEGRVNHVSVDGPIDPAG